jgi:prolyl-tRNA synthetase
MRYSTTLIPTLKEVPNEARTVSHRLMLRAGLIRPLTAGIYTWLPLGLRVLRHVEAIVREEMNRAGAQEVLMPAVQPAELWQESGRWDYYGKELLRMVDRHERDYCFGPTHEEVITDLVRREIRSYRQLPANFYQIQTKFRDEIRPRFGIMRGREFLMKDAYSFDLDEAGLDRCYQGMFEAYQRIFRRCGLRFRAVEADTGAIGGASSHEFHVLADSGEDGIASCTACAYAANLEKAQAGVGAAVDPQSAGVGLVPMQEVATPGQKSIDEVCRHLSVASSSVLKSLVVATDGDWFLVLLRGDHELNEVKLRHHLGTTARLPDETEVRARTGLPVGSIGPCGTSLRVLADMSTRFMVNMVCGANREGYHLTGVNWQRDVPIPDFADLRNVVVGDPCPRCATGTLALDRGIEVGHVFKLGLKYSRAMNVVILDEQAQERHPMMGCYGIGVSRIVAAAIEQNHDDNGICWPLALAPFQVEIILMNPKEQDAAELSASLYAALGQQGIDVLWDDRDERPGVKFKDADLLGIPIRLLVGGRSLKEGFVEVQFRSTGHEPLRVAPGECVERVREVLRGLTVREE